MVERQGGVLLWGLSGRFRSQEGRAGRVETPLTPGGVEARGLAEERHGAVLFRCFGGCLGSQGRTGGVVRDAWTLESRGKAIGLAEEREGGMVFLGIEAGLRSRGI